MKYLNLNDYFFLARVISKSPCKNSIRCTYICTYVIIKTVKTYLATKLFTPEHTTINMNIFS